MITLLLQVVLKVLCDALVQVHALVTHHVVSLARVREEVGLCASADRLEKLKCAGEKLNERRKISVLYGI